MRLLISLTLVCLLVCVVACGERNGHGKAGKKSRNKRNVNDAPIAPADEQKNPASASPSVATPAPSVTYPWAGNAKCAKFEVNSVAEGRIEPPAILIMERVRRNGLEQVKRAIENSTGVAIQVKKSSSGSPLLRVVNFSNTEGKDSESASRILLLRNPMKAVLSRDLFEKSKDAQEAKKRVAGRVKWWISGTRHWIRSGSDSAASKQKFMLIQADKFLTNPKRSLEQVHKFLNVSVDKERLECVLEDLKLTAEALKKSNQIYRRMWKKVGASSRPAKMLKKGVARLNRALAKRALPKAQGGKKSAPIRIKLNF